MREKIFGLFLLSLGLASPAFAAEDTLSRYIKALEYAPAVPAPKTIFIGDIFERANLKDYAFRMDENFSEAENGKFMESLGVDAEAANESGSRLFQLSATADVIGKMNASLKAHGISHFSVTVGGLREYKLSTQRWKKELRPRILEKMPLEDAAGRFMVTSLLRVSTLEYSFFDAKGGKVNLGTDAELEQVIKASLGVRWAASQKGNLTITSPTFIGYRMARIDAKGEIKPFSRGFAAVSYTDAGGKKRFDPAGLMNLLTFNVFQKPRELVLVEIPADELRREAG